jgi:hypothetical protein
MPPWMLATHKELYIANIGMGVLNEGLSRLPSAGT